MPDPLTEAKRLLTNQMPHTETNDDVVSCALSAIAFTLVAIAERMPTVPNIRHPDPRIQAFGALPDDGGAAR